LPPEMELGRPRINSRRALLPKADWPRNQRLGLLEITLERLRSATPRLGNCPKPSGPLWKLLKSTRGHLQLRTLTRITSLPNRPWFDYRRSWMNMVAALLLGTRSTRLHWRGVSYSSRCYGKTWLIKGPAAGMNCCVRGKWFIGRGPAKLICVICFTVRRPGGRAITTGPITQIWMIRTGESS